MSRQKFDFPVGQKVRGYGLMNEYGEFDFIPEQTGSRQGMTKLIKETKNYTISTTKKKLLVYIRIEKQKRLQLISNLLNEVNNVIQDLKSYEI